MSISGALPNAHYIAADTRLIVAGLIVGLGTGLGSGCTSGHGICGLARSVAAVLTFMSTGLITTFILNHI